MKKLSLKRVIMTVLSAAMVFSAIPAVFADETAEADYEVIYSAQYEGKTSTNYTVAPPHACANDYLATDAQSKLVAVKPQKNNADITFDSSKTYILSLKMKKDSAVPLNFCFFGFCKGNYNGNLEYDGYDRAIRLDEKWQTYSWTFSGGGYTAAPWIRFQGGAGEDKFYLKDIKITELKPNIPELTAAPATVNTSNEIKIRYSYDMSDDAADKANYTIGGVTPQSVTYDSATKTATLVPTNGIVGTSADVTMNVSDVTGRTLNTVEVSSDNAGRKIIKFKTVTVAYPENTLGAPVPNVTGGTATIGGLYNTTSQEQKAMLIVAAFDDAQGCLVKAAVKNITIESGAVLRNQSVSLDAVPAGCSVKAFIWDASTLVAIEE